MRPSEHLSAHSSPLHTPVRTDQPLLDHPWRDNAYLAFWDTSQDVHGVVHVSTSPNEPGSRRARFSLYHAGRLLEVVEPLPPGTFSGEKIRFDLDRGVTVSSPQVRATLTLEPLHAVADYTGGSVFPSLLPSEPLHHYQQAASIRGEINIDGGTMSLVGRGFRDRTWGYRSESATIVEFIAALCVFEHFSATVMRFHVASDDSHHCEGFLLADTPRSIKTFSPIARDARGLFAGATLDLVDGTQLEFETERSLGGFWVPIGQPKSTGPTLSVYDEFCALRTADGRHGVGMIEQGSIRRLT